MLAVNLNPLMMDYLGIPLMKKREEVPVESEKPMESER